jgi:hypothetical protein
MERYSTSWSRALLGLTAGAAIGALLLTMSQADTFAQGLDVLPVLFAAVGVTMLVLGVPFWVSLHTSGARDWSDAMLLGGVMALAVAAAITGHARWYLGRTGEFYLVHARVMLLTQRMSAAEWTVWGMQVALAGIVGALVGLVVWKIAYRASS